jgi:hypothetical protein
MFQELKSEQARRIAALAKAARQARDAELGNVPDEAFGEPPTARGEHNPIATLGFEPLSPDSPTLRALRQAVEALTTSARSELFVLLRIGQGDLAAGDWDRGLSEAEMIGDTAVGTALMGDTDLHDHLMKALYEIKEA